MKKYSVRFIIEGSTMADEQPLSEETIDETLYYYFDQYGNPGARNMLDCKVSDLEIKEVGGE